MNNSVWEISTFLLFIGGLTAVISMKNMYINLSKEIYNKLVVALSILTVTAGAEVLNGFRVLDSVPFLSNSFYFVVICWMGKLTAMILLINAVSKWLPVYKNYIRISSVNIARLEIIKNTEQLIKVESRINVIIHKTIMNIINAYGFDCGAAYVYSNRKNKNICLAKVETGSVTSTSLNQFNSEKCDMSGSDRLHGSNFMTFPIIVDSIQVGLFAFGREESTFENNIDDFQDMKIAIGLISRKIQNERLIKQIEFQENLSTVSDTVSIKTDMTLNSAESIKAIVSTIGSEIEFDYFEIATLENYPINRENIYSRMNGNWLNRYEAVDTRAGNIKEYARVIKLPIYINDLGRETDVLVDNILLKCDMRSLVVIPLIKEGKTTAVISFASLEKDFFTANDRLFLESFKPHWSSVLTQLENEKTVVDNGRRQAELDKLHKAVLSNVSINKIFKYSANLISKELNPELVRISLVDTNRIFLNSKALVTDETSLALPPEDATMVLSLMPNHQKAISNRCAITVNGFNGEIEDSEMSQFVGFTPGVTTIIPISTAAETFGLITVVISNECDTIDIKVNDHNFITSIANLLMTALKIRSNKYHGIDGITEITQSMTKKNNRINAELNFKDEYELAEV